MRDPPVNFGNRGTDDRRTGDREKSTRGTEPGVMPGSSVPKASNIGQQTGAPGKAPASERGTPLTPAQRGIVNFAEDYRKLALRAAIGILLDFSERVTTGDPSIGGTGSRNFRQLSKKDAHTLRGLRNELSLAPNSFDWLNDRSAKLMLDAIQTVIALFIQNAQRTERHVFFPQPPNDPRTAAKADSPMKIFPAFFEKWDDPLGRVLAITHEYFHYLFVPGTRERIFHGFEDSQRSLVESALANAYSLSALAMWLAFGRRVNGF